jgi:hypothetical protein
MVGDCGAWRRRAANLGIVTLVHQVWACVAPGHQPAAEPRARLSRRGLAWALEAIVCQHLSIARVAQGLGVAWNTANDAVLAEGRRVLINDPGRLNGVKVIGVDEHVVRHEALLFRMEVRDLDPSSAGARDS